MMDMLPSSSALPYDVNRHRTAFDRFRFSFSDKAQVSMLQGFENTPEMMAKRFYEASELSDTEDDVLISESEFNSLYGDLGLEWDNKMSQRRAKIIAAKRERDIINAMILNRDTNFGEQTALFLTSILPQFASPTNIAMGAIPILNGGMAMKRFAQSWARWKQNAFLGAMGGTIGTGVLEPLNYLATEAEQNDYTATDFMLNTFVIGPTLGAGVSVPLGAVSDRISRLRAMRGEKYTDELFDSVNKALEDEEITGVQTPEEKPAAQDFNLKNKEQAEFSSEEVNISLDKVDNKLNYTGVDELDPAQTSFIREYLGIEEGADFQTDLIKAAEEFDSTPEALIQEAKVDPEFPGVVNKLDDFIVDSNIKTLIKNFTNEVNSKLTPQQKSVIKLHNTDYYQQLNNWLRGSLNEEAISPDNLNKFRKTLRALDRAMNKSFLPTDLTVTRKIKNAKNIFGDIDPNTTVGQRIKDEGFIMASLDSENLTGDVEIELLVPRGSKGVFVKSAYNKTDQTVSETEVMLSRDSEYLIKKVEVDEEGNIKLEADLVQKQSVNVKPKNTRYHSEEPDATYDSDSEKEPGASLEQMINELNEDTQNYLTPEQAEEVKQEIAEYDEQWNKVLNVFDTGCK